jgi:pimeloyl-ACP methyl ester carboxylesterase
MAAMANHQTGFAPINGAQLYYEVAGEGDPLVFVHAGVADSRLWDDQFPVFAEKYRVVRYDMRGYGKSEPVDVEFSHREDLYALLKFLEVERAHLVGCSMGGGFSMDIAIHHPDMAASLTMVCSGPGGLELDVPENDLAPLFEAAGEAWKARDLDKTAEIETRIWFDGAARTPEAVDPVKRAKALDMNRIALGHEVKGLGKNKPPLKPGAGERLAELQIPVLVIVGALDTPYLIAAADYMLAHIGNCRKVVIENTAHLPSLEHPNEFNRILSEFLNSL